MNIAEKKQLHEATLSLLEKTGVRLDSQPALDAFTSRNIHVDASRHRVYLREEQINAALATAPATFTIYGRRVEKPVLVGGREPLIMSGGASVRVLTVDGKYENAAWEHLRQFNVLLDALSRIDILLNQVDPVDNSGNLYKKLAAEMLMGTTKPCCLQAGNAEDIKAMLAMGAAIRGSAKQLSEKPLFLTGSNAEPPLNIPAESADILMEAGRWRIPCGIGDYVMMGTTAPRTIAGALVQRNAVQLTALVLSQINNPGAPFYYVAASGSVNMRTLDPVMASPAATVLIRSAIELGKYYKLPVYTVALTDAKEPDSQAACERTAQLNAALDAGADIIQGPTSMMDQMMLSSFAQAVIDHDIIDYLLSVRRPPAINEQTLALAPIAEIVGDPGFAELKFAVHRHTVEHMRDGEWDPLAFDYGAFGTWRKSGSPSIIRRANKAAVKIIHEHKPEQLPDHIRKKLMEIAES